MLRIVLSLLSVSLCGLGFLLEDQKPTVDHDLIRYLDTVVTTLVNLTTKLEKDIAIKNDLTQFLQSDLQQINGSLQAETQKRQTLENKVIQLERSIASADAANGGLQADLKSTKALAKSLQDELLAAKHQIDILKYDVNATKVHQIDDGNRLQNSLKLLKTDVGLLKNQTGKTSYFSVRNSQNTASNNTDSNGLKFTGVLSNYGDDYSITSGIFVAPYDGVYFFTLTLAATTDSYTSCYIVKNRFHDLVESFTSVVVGYCSATSSSVVHLAAGDSVSVDNCHGNGTYNSYKTSFTGFLLKAD